MKVENLSSECGRTTKIKLSAKCKLNARNKIIIEIYRRRYAAIVEAVILLESAQRITNNATIVTGTITSQ